MRTYERLVAERESARAMDDAWDRLRAAERSGAPVSECERLYNVYLDALDAHMAWRREQARRGEGAGE